MVTGEVYIRKADFEKVKEHLLDSSGRPYKNARNLAAGSVRSFDASACAGRRLRFSPFGVLEGLDGLSLTPNSKHAKLVVLKKLGFSTCGYYLLKNPTPLVTVVSEIDIDVSFSLRVPRQMCTYSPPASGRRYYLRQSCARPRRPVGCTYSFVAGLLVWQFSSAGQDWCCHIPVL